MSADSNVSFIKKDKKQLSWFITFIVPALIFFIPTTETFSYEIKLFMVFTLWGILMFAFELMNTLIPSLILPFLYVIFNLVPMSVAFSAWTTTVPWMCLGGFLLANILERIGLLKRMAYWCIIKTGGTYKGIVWGMFFFGIALNLALPGGSAVGVAAFAFGICRALNLGRSQAAAGIMISAALGNLLPGYFIYYPGNFGILFSIGQSVAPITIDYTTYLYHNAIFIPFGFILIFLITKIIKPEVSIDGKNYFIQEQKALGKITVPEKKATIAVLVLLIYMMTGSLHGLDIAYGFILIPTILFFPGINVAQEEDLKRVNYSFVFFVVGCMAIGFVATNLGLGKLISNMVLPTMQNLSTIGVISVTWCIAVVLNLLLTPLAAMSAFGAPLTQIAIDLGLQPHAILYTFFIGLDQIFLPYEYALYLVAFSFGLIHIKDWIKIFTIKTVLSIIYLLIVAVPYWMMIGIL